MSHSNYDSARAEYAERGVDAEAALRVAAATAISLPCWQGDDVGGFEGVAGSLAEGGLQVTGSHPGRARSAAELRSDFEQASRVIPSRRLRLNLHAMYGEFPTDRPVDRSRLLPSHFSGWMDWARARGFGLDFNPTLFAHPLAADGFTLSHRDPKIRQFWIDHTAASRRVGAALGAAQGSPAITNVWIPDGCKDTPADRKGPRERLITALDEAFREALDPAGVRDAVEGKLFGLGSESYVVGSHEFYCGYAISRQKLLCLDLGHFHPTESVADKISSLMPFVPGVLLHLSRGVRWDSDHVVLLDDPTRAVLDEVVRGGYLDRTWIGLDYFDASINRVAAWVIGARNTLKALLAALLQPAEELKRREEAGDATGRLACLEDAKTLPLGAVWAELCRRAEAPGDGRWLSEIETYERQVLAKRR
ncbi:MAG TPA: L-rhamnose isomerase [Opitutaceae bacterium]|jgi:L-rhamnose isomerase